jgi:Transposase zinc-binding domain
VLWNAALRVELDIQVGQLVTAASLARWSQPIAAARPSLCPVVLPGVYEPRTMTGTVLHDVVRTYLDRFLTEMAAATDAGLSRFIEREFRDFLGCGHLDPGFALVRCDACRFERLVPFSCKARAICPSCGGRRMAEQAAHLVDAVLPWVPVRQWVLTVPHQLRYRLAFRGVGVWHAWRGKYRHARRVLPRAGLASVFVERFPFAGGHERLHPDLDLELLEVVLAARVDDLRLVPDQRQQQLDLAVGRAARCEGSAATGGPADVDVVGLRRWGPVRQDAGDGISPTAAVAGRSGPHASLISARPAHTTNTIDCAA